jgi:sugar phosphate isomerase/epimerase
MHVKDLESKSDKESQVAVGRGVIDFPALFKTLIEIGYQGQVGLEYEINAKNPLPGMIESMAYMRGVLAAVTT